MTRAEEVAVRVVHCKREPYDIYIGRPGPWGNPFPLDNPKDAVGRARVIQKYRNWLRFCDDEDARWVRAHLSDLAGKVLGCWCYPNPCHGDVLAEAVLCPDRFSNPKDPKSSDLGPDHAGDENRRI